MSTRTNRRPRIESSSYHDYCFDQIKYFFKTTLIITTMMRLSLLATFVLLLACAIAEQPKQKISQCDAKCSSVRGMFLTCTGGANSTASSTPATRRLVKRQSNSTVSTQPVVDDVKEQAEAVIASCYCSQLTRDATVVVPCLDVRFSFLQTNFLATISALLLVLLC